MFLSYVYASPDTESYHASPDAHISDSALYVRQSTTPPPKPPTQPKIERTVRAVVMGSYCSCVSYARQVSPKDVPQPSNARDVKPTHQDPKVGDWVIFRPGGEYSYWGHIAVVTKVEDGTLTITEANYIPCRKSQRVISIDDSAILGYR